jgi:hypothetical protein
METKNYTYTLKNPFMDDKGFEIKELSVRQGTVGDLLASEELGGGAHRQTLNLFSVLSGLSPQCLEKINLRDWLSFAKGANHFLGLDS